jgi:hypothetical protein
MQKKFSERDQQQSDRDQTNRADVSRNSKNAVDD